jgi:phage recombination protein Bet
MNEITRIPMPAGFSSPDLWQILTTVIFPRASNAKIIELALRYCTLRGLDVLKRPVNIVPVYDSDLRRSVETIWPSITETEITASRSGQWAGLDLPVFGPDVTKVFHGKRKDISWDSTVTFPEYCDRTVYRLIGGERRAFSERVHWLEAYGRQGGSDLPNYMWAKRPRDQIAKVAKAAALRSAFPEESGGPTAEETEDMIVPGESLTPPPAPIVPVVEPKSETEQPRAIRDEQPNSHEQWREFGMELAAFIRAAPDLATVRQWVDANASDIDDMKKAAPRLEASLQRAIKTLSERFAAPPDGADEYNPETGEIP